jgi:radical SAM-linked protein
LAVGVTSDAELLDIWLRKWVPPQSALMMARSQLPVGFTLLDAWEVPNGAPALQTMVQTARYECIAMHQIGVAEAQRAAGAFMQAESVVHHFIRGGEEKEVDLRPLVREIVVRAGPNDSCRIDLEVRIGQEGSARPDHVLSELGFVEPAIAIHRAALSFEQSGSDASEDSPRPR